MLCRRAVAVLPFRRFAVPMLAHHLASPSLALQGMFFLPLGVGSGSIGGIGGMPCGQSVPVWAGWLIVCGVVGVLV